MSLALSGICMISILTLLLHFGDKSISAWHSKLEISTILSILATALNTSTILAATSALGQLKWIWFSGMGRKLQDFQLMDDASRGPLGAILLLLRRPWSLLACLGSVVVIMGIASGAAIQASTNQELRPDYTLTAQIPVSQNNKEHGGDDPLGSPDFTDSRWIDPLFQTVIYAATLRSRASLTDTGSNASNVMKELFVTSSYATTSSCDTGNCTFAPYVSLSVRSTCSSPNQLLQFHENGTAGSVVWNIEPAGWKKGYQQPRLM